MNKRYKALWYTVIALILLSPLGLIIPQWLKAGGAWGEWGEDELKNIAGYVPEGFKRLSEIWKSPFTDYAFNGWGAGTKAYISYMASGIIGVLAVAVMSYIIGRLLTKKNGNT